MERKEPRKDIEYKEQKEEKNKKVREETRMVNQHCGNVCDYCVGGYDIPDDITPFKNVQLARKWVKRYDTCPMHPNTSPMLEKECVLCCIGDVLVVVKPCPTNCSSVGLRCDVCGAEDMYTIDDELWCYWCDSLRHNQEIQGDTCEECGNAYEGDKCEWCCDESSYYEMELAEW